MSLLNLMDTAGSGKLYNDMKINKNIPLIFMLFIMAILAFANLGNRFMYLDEAETALLGKNILTYGYPRAWDGNFLITAANGNDFDQNFVFIRYPWLQYYIAAFGQILGNTNFCVRFWFVILGVISIIPLYRLALNFTERRQTALIAAALYSLSIPVLIYVRSVRYYSPSLLFTILTYLFYLKFIKTPSYKNSIYFSIVSILLFHSFHAFFFITMAVMILCYIIFDFSKENIKKFIISLIIITLFTLPPFIYYYSHITYLGTTREGFQGLYLFLLQLPGYFWIMHVNFFPVIPLLSIIVIIKVSKRLFSPKKRSNLMPLKNRIRWLLIGPIIIDIIFVSLFSIYFADRFLIACIPSCFILSAVLICKIIDYDKIFGFILAILLIFTNILHISPYIGVKALNSNTKLVESVIKPPLQYFYSGKENYSMTWSLQDYLNLFCRIRSYLFDYCNSTSHDYDDEVESAVKFLNKYAKKGDTVETDDWLAYPIYYYTGLNVVNRLRMPDGNSFYALYYNTYKIFPNAYKYYDLVKYDKKRVDWAINMLDSLYQGDLDFWRNSDEYEKIIIHDYPISLNLGMNNEYPFFSVKNGPTIEIYRNKNTTLPIDDKYIGKIELESPNRKY